MLAKQQVGATKSDQYWGASLAAVGDANDMDGLRKACGVAPPEAAAHSADPADGSPTLGALALCLHPDCAPGARLLLEVVPLLVDI